MFFGKTIIQVCKLCFADYRLFLHICLLTHWRLEKVSFAILLLCILYLWWHQSCFFRAKPFTSLCYFIFIMWHFILVHVQIQVHYDFVKVTFEPNTSSCFERVTPAPPLNLFFHCLIYRDKAHLVLLESANKGAQISQSLHLVGRQRKSHFSC